MSVNPRAKRRPRRLSAEERALWQHVARTIQPLPRMRSRPAATSGLSDQEPEPAPPRLRLPRPAPDKPVQRRTKLTPKPPPALAPLDRRLKQKLARGTETLDARLDLHGMTQKQAYAELRHFLHRVQAIGARHVLVITGKGAPDRGADRERGVLKRQVPFWLRSPELRPYVIGFENAGATHGGEGALYLRIRRGRSP